MVFLSLPFLMPAWILQCHITFPDFEYLIKCLNPMLPVHARAAGKTQQSYPKNFILGLPCSTCILSFFSTCIIPFFFPFFYTLPTPLPGKVTGSFLSEQILSPLIGFHLQEKNKQNKNSHKSKANKKTHQPKHFGCSSPSTHPVNLILAVSHNLCGPTHSKVPCWCWRKGRNLGTASKALFQ